MNDVRLGDCLKTNANKVRYKKDSRAQRNAPNRNTRSAIFPNQHEASGKRKGRRDNMM